MSKIDEIFMRKHIAILFFAITSIFFPTATNAQFRYAPVAGITVNNLVFKQDLVPVWQQVGYTGGIQGELMFPGIGLGIDLGLMYNQQGAKVGLGEKVVWSSQGYGDERVYIHSLLIPVHLRFKYTRLNGLEEIVAPFVYGGPDFNIQLAHGKCEAFEYSGGDLGLTAGIGAELFQRWQLTASYTWGMTYVLQTKLLDSFTARSRQWTVRLAYFF